MELLRPALPVCQRLPSVMAPGTRVVVSGVVDKKPSRFHINLQTEAGDDADVALHFSPRFEDRVLVRLNSQDSDIWHDEVRVSGASCFGPETPFCVEITCEQKGYFMVVNRKSFASLPHRLDFNRVHYVAVDGCVKIDRLAVF